MSEQQRWRLTLQTWVRLLALGLTIWFVINHAGLIVEVLTVVFGAWLLSLAMRPLAKRLAHQRIPRWLTVLYVYVGLVVVLVLLASLIRPVIAVELASLAANGPKLFQEVIGQLNGLPLVGQWVPSGEQLTQQLGAQLGTLGKPVLSALTSFGSLLLDVLLVLVLAFFFTTDVGLGRELFRSWVPPERRDRAWAFIDDVSGQLTRWVWAQLGVAVYFALAFSIGLTLLQVPYAVTIGIVGGALEVIPYVGGLVAVLLGIFSALTVHPVLALWVIVLHMVVSIIESHVIAPALYGRVMNLHPAVVLLALFAGAKLGGVPGVLFAIPVAVIIVAVVQEAQADLAGPAQVTEAPARREKV